MLKLLRRFPIKHPVYLSYTFLNRRPIRYSGFHKMSCDDPSNYVLPNKQPVVVLDCDVAFSNLTKQEKLYAHYLSKASWNGGLIVLLQTSQESGYIFCLLHKIFLNESVESLKKKVTPEVSDENFTAFLIYSCGIFANAGNYKGFGDTKFLPNLPKEVFELIVKKSKAMECDSLVAKLWDCSHAAMYLLTDNVKSLGFPGKGVTTYFSSNCTTDDVTLINKFLKKENIEGYNTRAVKLDAKPVPIYEIRFAAFEQSVSAEMEYEGAIFKIVKGDYSSLLKLVNDNLNEAQKYASNANEVNMINKYVESFKSGSLDAHKDGSRYWIKDKGPIVETYIGFIETYRDPNGIRGEFEGFVAIVNKEMSKKFEALVNKAEELLEKLPWPKEFEKDTFQKPDFTSLDVLTFAGSGIPCGINIPNYDDIRQNEGFKNVSLGNVIPCSFKDSPFPFLSSEDRDLVIKYAVPSFELQVGLHELLGHGSGKLFHRTNAGVFDFDAEKIINPITGKKIESWYNEGDTYDSVFEALGSSYEECRAECVGLYLCLNRDVVKIFVEKEEDIDNVVYVNWLLLLTSGVEKALEMYSPVTKMWLQAHCQARFVIARVLLEAPGLVSIEEVENGKKLRLTLNRDKIHSAGLAAMKDFLMKLQVYKSTADLKSAKGLFDKYSEVSNEGSHPWASWRDIVLSHKQPRKIFVQSNTVVNNGDVQLKSYSASLEGFIESWVDRLDEPQHAHASIVESCLKDEQLYKYE